MRWPCPEKKWWKKRKESEFAWRVPVQQIIDSNFNLDIKNPNTPEAENGDPEKLLAKIPSRIKLGMYVSAVAKRLGISDGDLLQEIRRHRGRPGPPPKVLTAPSLRPAGAGFDRDELRIMACMLHQPTLIATVLRSSS